MATSPRTYESGPWDELDSDLEVSCSHAPPEEIEAIDRAIGLQMVSMRLQPELVKNLKLIASHHGIGYQPMIRDLLNRFALSEIKQILQDKLAETIRQEEQVPESVESPVTQFLERERKRA